MIENESVFVRAFKRELKAWQHEELVKLYVWADEGPTHDRKARAEAWAKEVEDHGLADYLIAATAHKPCPECGR